MLSSFKLLNNALRSVCSRVKRVCGYNRTYLCAQRPVPRALYVYIYIARLISEKTRKWPEKKFFHNIFFFFYGKHFCSEGAEKLVHVHASTYPGRPAPTFFQV